MTQKQELAKLKRWFNKLEKGKSVKIPTHYTLKMSWQEDNHGTFITNEEISDDEQIAAAARNKRLESSIEKSFNKEIADFNIAMDIYAKKYNLNADDTFLKYILKS